MEQRTWESFSDVRRLVDDLFLVRPSLYWLDFTLTMLVAWGSFIHALNIPWHAIWPKFGWLLLSTFAFFRGMIFTHEMAHVRLSELPGFRLAWNLFCGMFCFIPDYTYIPHAYHHRPATFSTKEDPEYIPVAYQRAVEILSPFFLFPFIPLVMAFRFLVAGPLSLVIGGSFREWLLRHASTLKMNPRYEWTTITSDDRRTAMVQDLLCFFWWLGFAVLCRFALGWQALAQAYVILYCTLMVNHLRSLARHRYINASGESVSYEAQILDSVSITGFSPASALLMPIGLRYHSVHHMFPMLPYYSLRQAHERLSKALPESHPYMKTRVPNFTTAISNFIRTVRSHEKTAR